MIERKIIPIERLRSLVSYNPETGEFTWRDRGDRFSGKRAFNAKMASGYLRGRLDGVYHTAHRIAWAYIHGIQPNIIDHINGDKSDNRLINLRSVNTSANASNIELPRRNRSGEIGILEIPGRPNPWRATVHAQGKCRLMKQFPTKGEAVAARNAVWAQYGIPPTHGRKL